MLRTYCFSCGTEMEDTGQDVPVCTACANESAADSGEISDDVRYRIKRGDGRSEGPLTYEQVEDRIRKGLLSGEDRCRVGDRDWGRVDQTADFEGYFIPGDPKFEDIQRGRKETAGAIASRKRRETASSLARVGVVLAVLAILAGLYFAGATLIDDETLESVQEEGGSMVDAAILKIRKAMDPEVARKDLEEKRGLPGQEVIDEIAAAWPDATGSIEERLTLGRLGLLQGTRAGWGAAQREFEYAVAVDPNNVDALAGLAVVYAQFRDEDPTFNTKSLALYDRAAKIDGKAPAVLRAQAGMSIMAGAWEDAESRSRKCLESVPDDGICLWYLGNSLTQLGRYSEAEKALSASKTIMGDVPVVDLSLGRSALETYQYSKAGAPLRAFADRYPDDPDIHALLARYHNELGDYDSAIEEGLLAISLDESGAFGSRVLAGGLLLHHRGDAAKAAEVLGPATPHDASPDRDRRISALLPASIAAREAGELADSLDYATALADLAPGYPPAQLSLALTYYAMGNESDAEDALKQADTTAIEGRDLARFHTEAGRFYTEVGRARLAHFEYDAAHKADPTWPTAAVTLARSYLAVENPQSALDTLHSIWKMDLDAETHDHPIESVPIVAPDMRAFDVEIRKAIPQGDQLSGRLPVTRGTLEVLRCLSGETSCDRARTSLSDAKRSDESDVAARVYLAWIALEQGRYESAIEDLDRALTNDPVQPILLSLRGLAYANLGDADAAARDFKTAHKHGVSYSGISRRNAEALIALGDEAGALSMSIEAVKSDDRDVTSRKRLLALQGDGG
ncbi:MAG: tetratricopeptide repeat protein [Proteobacteria bacterium]|nr:tetratricopeptide repeat protein [Pseudomonadota bacterium]MCP4916932.1 tetratricopeptide repeat protein [Pseudomonadota bacterium]